MLLGPWPEEAGRQCARSSPPRMGGHSPPPMWYRPANIIETEQRGFAGRIKVILDGDDPSLAEWDQEAVAPSGAIATKTWPRCSTSSARCGAPAWTSSRGCARPSYNGQHPSASPQQFIGPLFYNRGSGCPCRPGGMGSLAIHAAHATDRGRGWLARKRGQPGDGKQRVPLIRRVWRTPRGQ